jgi:decaheme cytochrome c component MtrC/MtrF-like protein/cytochrome c3-like protein
MSARCLLIRLLSPAIVCAVFALPHTALAIDPPHNALNCADCHIGHQATYPSQLATLCQSCHFDLGPGNPGVNAPTTHSSLTIDNSFGDWDLDCWACHNPHKQDQDNFWGTSYGKFLRKSMRAQIKIINPADPGPYYAPLSIDRTVSTTNTIRLTDNTEFVDGDGSSDDDICQVCHDSTLNFSNIGGPAFNTHTQGISVSPGANCTSCHTHVGGFTPTGGSCVDCHNQTQPFVDGVPSFPTDDYRRQVTTTGGDFERASHHVTDGTTTEIVTQEACEVCHDQTDHQNQLGSNDPTAVLLNNADSAANFTYDGTGASVEGFCTSCHDTDGSTVSGSQPFFTATTGDDTNTPTDLATNWAASSHGTTSVTELATDKCLACHGGTDATTTETVTDRNIHGGSNASLLSDLVAGDTPASTAVEDLCFVCHDSDGPSSFDINTSFNPSPTYSTTGDGGAPIDQVHDLSAMNGCNSCHNPHMANSTNKTVDPDDTTTAFTATYAVGNSYGGQAYDSGGNFDPINPAGFQGGGGSPATVGPAVKTVSPGNDTAVSGGNYDSGPEDQTYTVEVTTGGQPPAAEITVSSDGAVNDSSGPTSVSAFGTPVTVGTHGVNITFTEGGGTPAVVGPAADPAPPNDGSATSGGSFNGGSDDTYTVTVTTGGTVGAGGYNIGPAIDPAPANSNDTAVSGGTYTGGSAGTYTVTVTTAGKANQAVVDYTSDIAGDTSGNVCGGAGPNCAFGSPLAVGVNGVTITITNVGGGQATFALNDDWTIAITALGGGPEITVTSTLGDNLPATEVTAFGTPFNVGTLGPITITFTDGGSGGLTLNDYWTIAATAAIPGDGLTSGDTWTIDVTAATGSCWPNCVEPDYVAFCLTCHDGTTPPGVTMPGNMVDMLTSHLGGDQHGNGDGSTGSNTSKGPLKRPWTDVDGDDPSQNYAALPCTTCHDQHGSANIFHLRTSINIAGQDMMVGSAEPGIFDGVSPSTTYTIPANGGSQTFLEWGAFCTFCHTMSAHTGVDEASSCNSGHVHGGNNF